MSEPDSPFANDRNETKGLLVFYAVVYSFGLIIFLSGGIPRWGAWYSPSRPHRAQTEAFLRGQLALSTNISDLADDLCWSECGVQQVWGLGVPLWRLPFEAVARIWSDRGFPDRLALAIFGAVTAYVVLRASNQLAGCERYLEKGKSPSEVTPTRPYALLVLLFPPFLSLVMARGDVYGRIGFPHQADALFLRLRHHPIINCNDGGCNHPGKMQ